MSLPSETVDTVFTKLSLAYGHRFLSIWDGMPLDAVKADWAHELAGLDDAAIAYGLANLPAGRPPDVFQFRDICRRRTEDRPVFKLTHDRKAGVPENVREQLQKLAEPHDPNVPERLRWARSYVERFGAPGMKLTPTQRTYLMTARRIAERHEATAEFEAKRQRAQQQTEERLAQEADRVEQ